MRAFVVLACIAASASASLDPFEAIPQLEPFKGVLPTWLNSTLYDANPEDLVILKELIANGTTVSSVDELLKVLKANGDVNLVKVLSSAYAAVDKELEKLPAVKHLVSVISAELGKVASKAIDDVDIEAVRNLAAKAVKAYESLNATVALAFEKVFPGTSKLLKDPKFREIVQQTTKIGEAVQGRDI